jgi:hypothetical protein
MCCYHLGYLHVLLSSWKSDHEITVRNRKAESGQRTAIVFYQDELDLGGWMPLCFSSVAWMRETHWPPSQGTFRTAR